MRFAPEPNAIDPEMTPALSAMTFVSPQPMRLSPTERLCRLSPRSGWCRPKRSELDFAGWEARFKSGSAAAEATRSSDGDVVHMTMTSDEAIVLQAYAKAIPVLKQAIEEAKGDFALCAAQLRKLCFRITNMQLPSVSLAASKSSLPDALQYRSTSRSAVEPLVITSTI
jgi:hypothetical protein